MNMTMILIHMINDYNDDDYDVDNEEDHDSYDDDDDDDLFWQAGHRS